MRQNNIKTKGFNEIYFVLYLTALILIVPKADETINIEYDKLPSYYVKTEKTSLTVSLTIKDGKPQIVSADTINYIYTIGDYKDVNYNLKIRNNTIERVIFSGGKNTDVPGFKIAKEGGGNLKFVWDLDTLRLFNKNYDVFVEAEIKEQNDEIVYASTRFNLNVIIIDKYPTQITSKDLEPYDKSDSSEIFQPIDNSNPTQIASERVLPDIDFSVENPVYSVALTPWKATLRVFGLNSKSDLEDNPAIEVQAPEGFDDPDVRIVDLGDRYIEITGNTPSYGSLKVKLSLERKEDGQKANTEFIVKPIPLPQPDYPKVVYPYITYKFDPKFPNQMGSQLTANLTLNNQVYDKITGNKIIEFTPIPKYIGEPLFFGRYINGKLIGTKYPIKIAEYPEPEIVSIKKEGNIYKVFTKSFGFTSPSKHNLVEKLLIENSDAKIIDLTGFTEIRKEYATQVFEISGENLSGRNVEATDGLERKSLKRVFP